MRIGTLSLLPTLANKRYLAPLRGVNEHHRMFGHHESNPPDPLPALLINEEHHLHLCGIKFCYRFPIGLSIVWLFHTPHPLKILTLRYFLWCNMGLF